MKLHETEKILTPVKKTGKFFYLLTFILIAVTCLGLCTYSIQEEYGEVVTDMRDLGPGWGLYIVNAVFFLGVAHGGILISAVVTLLKMERYRPVARIGEVITVTFLILLFLGISFDVGRIERLIPYVVMVYGRLFSPFIWTGTILYAYFFC